jgi:OmpA-OmpF porin, OOP family
MNISRTCPWFLLAVLVGIPLIPVPADAQIGQRIRDRARQQVEHRAEDRAAEAVDRALDATENAVVCMATDDACIQAAQAEGQEVALTDARGAPVAREDYPSELLRPGEGAWVNYDFVPGERVLFTEDFSRDNVGDFPRRLEFENGIMEVAEWQGQRWLRSTGSGRFVVVLPETLPQRFTLEFEQLGSVDFRSVRFDDQRSGPRVVFGSREGGVTGPVSATGRLEGAPREGGNTVRVMADGNHVKVYLNETRVANVPNIDLGRSNRIRFDLGGSVRTPTMFTNLRIAAGGRALYDALTTDGRVVTRGILFDTGSDRIRPESTPTLKEIGDMLSAHGELRLRVEGHTDSVGSAAANQSLSERRAQSVRRYLIERHGIDEARLEALGLGQTQPMDSNDTPEGRQNNRRVELVRL